MKMTLPEFERVGVMVAGDVMLDRCWCDPTNRVSLGAPVLVIKMDTTEERPSGVADVAINTTSLGANSRLAGLIGIDDAARAPSKMLTDASVKCSFVSVPTYPAITKLHVLSRNQQLVRLGFEGGFGGVDPQPLHECVSQVPGSIGALMLSDCAKGMLVNVQQMITLARKTEVPVLIDPKGADFERYRGATLLTPNLSELKAVTGKRKSEDELVERGIKVVADFDLSTSLTTRPEQGMMLLQLGKSPLHMPMQAQEVYDVAGADDTAIGVLAATLVTINSLEEACYFASAAADVIVGKLGTSTVPPIELENAVRGRANTGFGVINESELRQAATSARKCGEKAVMTNGVFDILHAGHVSCLVDARKLGDRLIVAVNSDASTKRLKDETCLVNPSEQRMIVLGALGSTDWVISLEEDTPQRLITGILPDLLVKGGDYKPEQIAGSEEVWTDGGEALVLNFEDSCSITNITKKIQKDSDK